MRCTYANKTIQCASKPELEKALLKVNNSSTDDLPTYLSKGKTRFEGNRN